MHDVLVTCLGSAFQETTLLVIIVALVSTGVLAMIARAAWQDRNKDDIL